MRCWSRVIRLKYMSTYILFVELTDANWMSIFYGQEEQKRIFFKQVSRREMLFCGHRSRLFPSCDRLRPGGPWAALTCFTSSHYDHRDNFKATVSYLLITSWAARGLWFLSIIMSRSINLKITSVLLVSSSCRRAILICPTVFALKLPNIFDFSYSYET